MMGYLQALGQAMFAAGIACDYLNIPYRGWVFGSTSALIQSTGRIWPVVPDCLGGTNPVQALEWMRDTPREGRAPPRAVHDRRHVRPRGLQRLRDREHSPHRHGLQLQPGDGRLVRREPGHEPQLPRAVGITSLAQIPAAIGQYIEQVL